MKKTTTLKVICFVLAVVMQQEVTQMLSDGRYMFSSEHFVNLFFTSLLKQALYKETVP